VLGKKGKRGVSNKIELGRIKWLCAIGTGFGQSVTGKCKLEVQANGLWV